MVNVRITNATRGVTLVKRCRVARSAVDRSIGLLRTPALTHGQGLLIERSPSIHMFFMRYPIDVIFIDTYAQVTKTVERLRPWRAVLWARGARDCIELCAGDIATSGTSVGDQLVVEPLVDKR